MLFELLDLSRGLLEERRKRDCDKARQSLNHLNPIEVLANVDCIRLQSWLPGGCRYPNRIAPGTLGSDEEISGWEDTRHYKGGSKDGVQIARRIASRAMGPIKEPVRYHLYNATKQVVRKIARMVSDSTGLLQGHWDSLGKPANADEYAITKMVVRTMS
ncbi:hypothetical protein BGZ51_000392 [Haplosporangium sp. Z 767]|nr:hypothetical protein BGZ51_000392 [Haplosporangium sp. Z 767]